MATNRQARQNLIDDFEKEDVVHLLCDRIDALLEVRAAAVDLFQSTTYVPGSFTVGVKMEKVDALREVLLATSQNWIKEIEETGKWPKTI